MPRITAGERQRNPASLSMIAMADKELGPQEFERLFTEAEPEELRRYLAAMRTDQPYIPGSTVPLLHKPFFAGEGGLFRPPGAAPAPIDYVSSYLTLGEYIAVAVLGDAAAAVRAATAQLLEQHPTDEMMKALAILDYATHEKEMVDQIQRGFAERLKPETRARFVAAMSRADEPRAFLGRQGVLAAMRLVLTRDSPAQTRGRIDPMTAAILLVHAVSWGLNERDEPPPGEELAPGIPTGFAMEILRNLVFYETDDKYSVIDRHIRLWRHYGSILKRHPARAAAADLLEEATGLAVEDLLALGFACYSHVGSWRPGTPLLINHSLGVGMDPEKVKRFVDIVAADMKAGSAELADPATTWDFLPFERHPILSLPEGMLVLDPGFLFERFTTGLYWLVHDHERDHHGDAARRAWTQAYGEMVEGLVEDMLQLLAPEILGGGRTFFTEEDFAHAFGGRIADAGIDFGADFCLFEVVSGFLHTETRLHGNIEQFKRDVERFVLKKARQLNETATQLLKDESPLTGLRNHEVRRVIPVIVVGGGWPNEPFTSMYVADHVTREGLFRDARIAPLAIIDIPEVEMLEGLQEHRGWTTAELLREWKGSGLATVSFRNFLMKKLGGAFGPKLRPSRMEAEVQRAFNDMIFRLKFPKQPESGDAE